MAMYRVTQDHPLADPLRRLLSGPAARAFLGIVAVIGATILAAGFLLLGLVSSLTAPSAPLTWVWYLAAVASAAAAVGASAGLNRLDRE